MILQIMAQVDDDRGLLLPDSGGAAVVFVLLVAIGAGLWFLLRSTRRRAEDEFWGRSRDDENGDPS